MIPTIQRLNLRPIVALAPTGGETAAFTCTTTGAATLTLTNLDVATGQTVRVKWGDGSQDDYTGVGQRTHNYAGAGTWSVTISNPTAVIKFNCADVKLSCSAGNIGKMTSLTYLRLYGLTYVVVGAGEIGGLTLLTLLTLNAADVVISAGEIGGLTSLTWLYLNVIHNATIGAGEVDSLIALQDLYLLDSNNIALQTAFPATVQTIRYENGLSQANVDAVLAGIYADRATFTYATPTLDLAGDGNAVPSGVYQAQCPPTTGQEYKYELVNDSCLDGFNKWAITTA